MENNVIDKIYIDGEFVTPHGTELIDLFNPATGKVIGQVRLADEVDTEAAVAAAKRALPVWSATSKEERQLLHRALAGLPARARAGTVRLRADAGYFAGELARAALLADVECGVEGGVEFAIGAKRIAPLWRLLDGVREGDWVDAIDMPGAQVATAAWCPDWWPAATRLLIRRVRLDVSAGQVSADPRSRRRRTLHPDQRVLPIAELVGIAARPGR